VRAGVAGPSVQACIGQLRHAASTALRTACSDGETAPQRSFDRPTDQPESSLFRQQHKGIMTHVESSPAVLHIREQCIPRKIHLQQTTDAVWVLTDCSKSGAENDDGSATR
jgi:hypothetical protein